MVSKMAMESGRKSRLTNSETPSATCMRVCMKQIRSTASAFSSGSQATVMKVTMLKMSATDMVS